jgi:hypothetical protein
VDDEDWDLEAERAAVGHELQPTPGKEWDGSFGTMPRIKVLFGPTVPDLPNIPEERWRDALLPLTEVERRHAVQNLYLGERSQRAQDLLDTLPPGFSHERAREAIVEGTALPVPVPERPPGGRQVNFRLDSPQYDRLALAAQLFGAKPSALARMLVTNGVTRMLADHVRSMDRDG